MVVWIRSDPGLTGGVEQVIANATLLMAPAVTAEDLGVIAIHATVGGYSTQADQVVAWRNGRENHLASPEPFTWEVPSTRTVYPSASGEGPLVAVVIWRVPVVG